MSNRLGRVLCSAVLTAICAASTSSLAAPSPASPRPEQPLPQPEQPADPPPKEPPEPRPVPDYDGRPEPGPTAGEVALWAPRVLLFPAYVVTEYVVRRPLGLLVTTAEREHWPAIVVEVLTFGPRRQAGIVPTAFYDFGFRPNVGFYFFWDDALEPRNDVRVHGATWGSDWLTLTVRDRYRLHPLGPTLSIRAEGTRRADLVFYGIGPRSKQDNESRYSSDLLESSFEICQELWRNSRVTWVGGVRKMSFGDNDCCGDPSVPESVAAGRFPMPPGFTTGYTILHHRLEGVLDSRLARPAPGSGVRFATRVEQSAQTSGDPTYWIRYGAALGGYLDVNDRNRTLGLTVAADFVDPIGHGVVPFTEQVRLGGKRAMRGFLDGRLVDRSAVSARLEYQWPVWTWLDAAIHYEVGNVFGEHLEGFEPELLRASFGVGLRANRRRDHAFELLTGFGTDTFADGGGITSFRLALGASREF